MPLVYYDPVPAWFDLRVFDEGPWGQQGFAVDIHPVVWGRVQEAIPLVYNRQYAESSGREKDLGEFIPPRPGEAWGFGPVIAERPTAEGRWPGWVVNLPKKDVERADRKIWHPTNWVPFDQAYASCDVLFTALRMVDPPVDEPKRQLLAVRTLSLKHGYSIGAEISPKLARWIGRFVKEGSRGVENAIRQAMITVFSRMEIYDELIFHQMSVGLVPKRRLALSVPGDRAGLFPPFGEEHSKMHGYQLTEHNIDNPIQALTLITGLARLNQLVREEEARPEDPWLKALEKERKQSC